LSRRLSSTSSPTPCIRVPRHIARLVVDYFASCRLVVDFIAYAARPGASARRAARRRLLRLAQARRRLLLLAQARTSRVRVPRHLARLVVDYSVRRDFVLRPQWLYFSHVVRQGASAHRAARHRLLRVTQARRRLHRLRRAPECLGTSRGSSSTTSPRASSSSTTSPTPRVRVPRHIVRLVSPLVIDYSVRRDYLSHGNTSSTSSTPRAAATSSSSRIASTIHLN
jgi:hypothetical protein